MVNCRKTLIVCKAVAGFLRQYALTLLLGETRLQAGNDEFVSSAMVGHERVRELFKNQCQTLYPDYKTLMVGSRWLQDLQQYKSALERVVNEDGVSVARGRRPWETTKKDKAEPSVSLNTALPDWRPC